MAKSVWWFCGVCGFKNKPHAFRRQAANESCEQCGSGLVIHTGGPDKAGVEDKRHIDYDPSREA